MPSSAGARAAALLTLPLAFLAAAAAGPAAAQAAAARVPSTPGWHTTVTRHYGARADASGFSAVTALSRTDAWAFGGTNPGGAGAPVALRWNGATWRSWPLPAGLRDFIGDASAPSPTDIWAVSYAGGYVLHWDGSRWLVAKRWRHHSVLSGVTALSPADVWTFGTTADGMPGLGTWHFDGRTWTQPAGPAQEIYRASAVTPADIWAVAATRRGGFIEHYDGRSWQRAGAGSPALAGLSLDSVLALPGGRVWAAGNQQLPRGGEGPLVIVHFNGRQWTRTRTSSQADTARLAPDGAGGLWITADDTGASGGGSLVGHLSGAGALSWMPLHDGLGSGISDVAAGLGPGPGPGPVWLSGGFLTQAGGDAAIWSRLGISPAGRPASGQPSVPAIRTTEAGGPGPARTVLLRRRGQFLGQVVRVQPGLDPAQAGDAPLGLRRPGPEQRAAVLIRKLGDGQRDDRARLRDDLVIVQAGQRPQYRQRDGVVQRGDVLAPRTARPAWLAARQAGGPAWTRCDSRNAAGRGPSGAELPSA